MVKRPSGNKTAVGIALSVADHKGLVSAGQSGLPNSSIKMRFWKKREENIR
jgi:hypothetical protein